MLRNSCVANKLYFKENVSLLFPPILEDLVAESCLFKMTCLHIIYSEDVFRSYFTFFWLLISNILFLACFGEKCIENSMLDIMYFVYKDMLHILFFILL